MSQPETVDVVVVGGGIVGLLAAREMVHLGLSVRLIDRDFTGPIRTDVGELAPLGGDAMMDNLYHHTLACWGEAGGRYGIDMGLATRGLLELATSAGRATMLAHEVQQESSHRMASVWLAEREFAAKHLATGLGDTVRGAKWWPEAPVISTHTVLEALRKQLALKGVRIWGQDEVVEFLTEGDVFTGVRIKSGETCLAKNTILTVGSLAGNLLKTVGPHLPLRPARTHQISLTGSENLGFPMVVHRLRRGHLWLKQTREGPVMMSYDGLMDPTQATFSLKPNAKLVDALVQHAVTLLPMLAGADVGQVHVATAAVTPDFRPALGVWEGMKGLYMATGFGARGYAFAAGAARLLGELVQGQRPTVNLQPFAPHRFAMGNWSKVGYPPSLAWEEPLLAATPQLVDAPSADYMDNIQLVAKPEAKFASNVHQVEKKVVQAGGKSHAEPPPPSNNVFGNSRVKAASVKTA